MRAPGCTLARWRVDILKRHRTGASNGHRGRDLLLDKVKRAGHGFRSSTACASCCTPEASGAPDEAAAALHPKPLATLKPEGPISGEPRRPAERCFGCRQWRTR